MVIMVIWAIRTHKIGPAYPKNMLTDHCGRDVDLMGAQKQGKGLNGLF
jgi:hypothetical protein